MASSIRCELFRRIGEGLSQEEVISPTMVGSSGLVCSRRCLHRVTLKGGTSVAWAKIKGVIPVAAAPFDEKGRVDYDGVRALAEFQVQAGANGIALFGFATEFYKLSEQEKFEFFRAVREQVAGRLPIITSITDQSTYTAIESAMKMQDEGADAIMVLPPFLIRAGRDAFVEHVRAVARAVSIPVIVQYSPEETGMPIDARTLVDLMNTADNLRYLKVESKPPGPMISQVREMASGDLGILVGYAGLQMIEALRRGAAGVMPGSSMTDIYSQVYRLYQSGRLSEAVAVHDKLVAFLNFIFQSIEMIVKWEKVILKRRGIIRSEYCRYPAYEPDIVAQRIFDEYYSRLSEELFALGPNESQLARRP